MCICRSEYFCTWLWHWINWVNCVYLISCSISVLSATLATLKFFFLLTLSHLISLAGVIIVPSAGVGIVLGGYIIKKLKLGARESAKLAMICSGVSLLCFSTLFIVGCESINLGGINIPYTTGWGQISTNIVLGQKPQQIGDIYSVFEQRILTDFCKQSEILAVFCFVSFLTECN